MEILFGDYRVRPRERELVGPDGPIELSSRSFDLLNALLSQPNELVDKAALFDAVWPGVVVEENTLQVHMSALRKALGPGFVATVHGRGYKYVGPPPREDEGTMPPRPAGSEGNIGRYRSDCIAREAEIETVARLLGQHRLVSVLGPGGVGKTTVAVAVAGTLGTVDGGIWMVDLASLNDGQFIESTLIQTLGVPFSAGANALGSVVEFLRHRETVLVFDNCEHVRSAAARAIRVLLAEAPDLRILCTSQVPLGLPEEHIFKLLPFAVDDDGEAASARFLAHCYEGFGEYLSAEELPLVARLCRRLDGMALAIKMAAARAATVGLETVDHQLAQQLATLEADWDPALARHRSLAASMEWSYDLLTAEDQRTLRFLGVFHGSFPIAAVDAVAGAGSEPSIAELVRRSLVVREVQDRSRYRLLDSTRTFAIGKLTGAGEDRTARDRHAAWVAAHFDGSIANWETMPDGDWDRLYRPDGGNLRAALAWARAQGNWPLYVDIAASSYRYFMEEQLGAEGLDTVDAGIARLGDVSPESAARLQLALGEMCRINAMDIRGRQVLQPAVVYFRNSGDRLRYALALTLLACIIIFFRPRNESGLVVAELDALVPEIPLSKVKAWALVLLGLNARIEGDTMAWRARAEAGLAMHLASGNPNGRSRSAVNLCEVLHKNGDTELAIQIGEQLLPDMRRGGSALHLCMMLTNLAAYNLALGRVDAAEAPLQEAARVFPRDGGHWHWCVLQGIAELYASRGAASEAAMLLGFTDRCFDGWPDGRQQTEARQRERVLALLDDALPKGERARLMQQGRSLTLFEADHLAGFVKTERPRLKV